MTYLAGVVGGEPSRHLFQRTQKMLAALGRADLPTSVVQNHGIAVGRKLIAKLDNDGLDEGPVATPDGCFLLTGDIRIDNSAEVAAALGIRLGERHSDVALMARAWQQWGVTAAEHVVGEYVVACWDRARRELTLVRSPSCMRPLFFREEEGATTFASLPNGLLADCPGSSTPDLGGLASMLGGEAYENGRTAHAGIRLLRHGSAAVLRTGRPARFIDLWRGLEHEYAAGSLCDHASAVREAMEQAVQSRLRRPSGGIASHLSAGRDSSAVTALAATSLLASGETLLALTGAPAATSHLPQSHERLWDETELAAKTAARHANIVHLLCRSPEQLAVADELDSLHAQHFGPLLNPGSLGWWNRTIDEAAANNAALILTGAAGNLSISAGGPVYLGDVRRRFGWRAYLAASARIARSTPGSLRNLIHTQVGSVLPRGIYLRLSAALHGGGGTGVAEFVREPLHSLVKQQERALVRRWTPRLNGNRLRLAALKVREPGELMLRHGCYVDLRDPTADWRVLKACFAVPANHLASPIEERPLWRAAFGDLLPPEVLNNHRRGYQGADWPRLFNGPALRAAFGRYRRTAAVADLIDLAAVDERLDRWPASGWDQADQIGFHRHDLLLALSLASFLHVQFG